ncbi:hypothetical protein Dimus_023821 [Dionaea muscipula]
MGSTAEIIDDDRKWLYSLSESEIEFLVTLKKLAFQRAKAIGHANWADRFDLKMLRFLGFILMRYVKDKAFDLSIPGLPISPAVFEGCNLLKSDFKDNDICSELLSFIESVTQKHSNEESSGVDTKKRKREKAEEHR